MERVCTVSFDEKEAHEVYMILNSYIRSRENAKAKRQQKYLAEGKVIKNINRNSYVKSSSVLTDLKDIFGDDITNNKDFNLKFKKNRNVSKTSKVKIEQTEQTGHVEGKGGNPAEAKVIEQAVEVTDEISVKAEPEKPKKRITVSRKGKEPAA
jgi:hypothetical protein